MPKLSTIGPRFHAETSYSRTRMPTGPSWARAVAPYREDIHPLRRVRLPEPQTDGGRPLWETIAARRSVREFSPEPVSLADLSQLLWATHGITGAWLGFRACASAGALHPNETHLVLNRVEGVEPGIAHYDARQHEVAVYADGDFSTRIAQACLGQDSLRQAAVVFAWVAVVERCAHKYRDRAYRYINLDAGHLGGQLQLAAAALDLGSVNIGAFLDDEVAQLLRVDGEYEIPVYLTAVGRPASVELAASAEVERRLAR